MSTWGLDHIHAGIEQYDSEDETEEWTEPIHLLSLIKANKSHSHSMCPRRRRIVTISQEEQNVDNNITSKHNAINGYLSDITKRMKSLNDVSKQNRIKINIIRIEMIKKINDRFNTLITQSDYQILKKQNQLNTDGNQLKQHKDELHHRKLQYNSYLADDEMSAKQRKNKIFQINDDLLSMDIVPSTFTPKVEISCAFDENVLFRNIDNVGRILNLSPNAPLFCIEYITDSSVTVQLDNWDGSVDVILEITDYNDIEWQIANPMNDIDEKEHKIRITRLEDNTSYLLRAKYKNEYGLSDYSEIKRVETLMNESLIEIGNENVCTVASSVSLRYKVGGALTIDFCKCYTLRIYVHYWLWQIPMLILNIILFCIWLSTDNLITQLGFLAVTPVFCAALIRDKIFLWFIYWMVEHLCWQCCCGQYGRYQFSRLADCIGGLHSSLGATALGWNIIYFIDLLMVEKYQSNVKTVTAGSLPLLLLTICLSAAPCFRFYCHNSFEVMHRYLNWLSLCFLLTHIYVINQEEVLLYPTLLAALLTILTVYPWFIIHRIKGANIEIIPSVTGASTAFIFPIWSPMGAVCKLSLNCAEFHVFGITPLPFDESKGYRSLVLIKGLGDWTDDLILKARNGELRDTLFWIHRIKPPNFSRGLFNFKKVFALATGAGIAPLIPYVVNTNYFDAQISLVWVARDHINNYPQFIVNIVKPLPNVVLYDTTKQPRCDLSLLTVQKAKEFEAEAVFIVSNQRIAYNVANYVNKKGIPVFASNFDV